MAKTPKPGSNKIADVAHPGQTAPSANSKSVIVSNRPLLKDPMVVDEAAPAGPPELPRPAQGILLKPAADPPETPTEPDNESKAKPEKSDQPDKPATDETPASDDRPSETDASDDKAPAPAKDKAALEAAAAEAAKHQAVVEKLADSKQYYLPINTVEKRRSRRFVLLGVVLSLLLIVAWADIALDAGLIHLGGIKPVTHFFSN